MTIGLMRVESKTICGSSVAPAVASQVRPQTRPMRPARLQKIAGSGEAVELRGCGFFCPQHTHKPAGTPQSRNAKR